MQIKWDLEHVYFYLVSFIALILIIVGAVNLTTTAIDYVFPIYDDYGPFAYEDMSQWEEEFGPDFVETEKARYDAISRENYQRRLARDFASGFAFILISLPVYLYHWRKIPKLESGNGLD